MTATGTQLLCPHDGTGVTFVYGHTGPEHDLTHINFKKVFWHSSCSMYFEAEFPAKDWQEEQGTHKKRKISVSQGKER